MFNRRPIRSLLKRKPGTRSTVEPYTTEELSEFVQQTNMAFETIKQFMIEISTFVEFEASEFVSELQDSITEIEKLY